MKQKLAIILRGQLREWKNAKHNFFTAMRQMEKFYDITYFVVTWDHSYFSTITKTAHTVKIHQMKKLSTIDLIDLKNDFKDKDFHLKILSYTEVNRFMKDFKLSEEYHLITYVRYIAGLIKQNYELENGVFFDKVIETRPDIFILPQDIENEEFVESAAEVLPNFVYHAKSDIFPRDENLVADKDSIVNLNSLFIDDLIFISNGLTSDILTSEFAFLFSSRYDKIQMHMFPHSLLADFLLNFKLINISNLFIYFKGIEILRPLEYFDKPVNLLVSSEATLEEVKKADQNFKNMKEKIK